VISLVSGIVGDRSFFAVNARELRGGEFRQVTAPAGVFLCRGDELLSL
jgi:hypothetical protein